MSLTTDDLQAIKQLFDESLGANTPKIIDERVPQIIDQEVPRMIQTQVQPMLDKLERRVSAKVDNLALDVGQFSLETTKKLSDKIDDLGDRLAETTDMADTNRIEIAKVKRKLGMA